MKKSLITLLAVILMSLSFTAAAAAAGEERAITVYFDDELMKFEADPFLQNGTTMVPFRAIFEKLGLTIGWDQATRKVTGKKEGLTIELQIGSKTALINGEKKAVSVAPVVKKEVTFIPLRFVIENADTEVSWDGRLKQVYIADTEQQIIHLFDKHMAYYQAEDVDGLLSTIDPASPGYEQSAALTGQLFAMFDFKTEAEYEIVEVKDDQATVQMKQTTTKVSGPEYPNTSALTLNRVVKVNGEWKLYSTEMLQIDYLNQALAAKGEDKLSAADKQAIRDVLEASRVNAEKEDVEAERKLYMADYPNLEQVLEQARQITAVFDFKYEYGNIEFLSGTDAEAKVKYAMRVSKVSGPAYKDSVSEYVVTFKKDTDGKWKYASQDILTVDYRTETVVDFKAAAK